MYVRNHAPNDILDSDFCGLERESMCRIHRGSMEKMVAFEDDDTGRHFYRYQNHVSSYLWFSYEPVCAK
jgi:hypothetical protein